MGSREIEPEPYTPKKFLKINEVFQSIGDQFIGLYQEDKSGNYGQDYTFKQRDGSLATITIKNLGLKTQLEKAALQKGEKVTITYFKDQDVGKDSPMRVFKVKVDDGGKKPEPVKTTEDAW